MTAKVCLEVFAEEKEARFDVDFESSESPEEQ